ncbi:MAG: DUF4097 family beta strand repeat-containing protein [Saonia sp.]
MKQVILCALLVASFTVQCAKAQKKESKEQIKKELSFSDSSVDNILVVRNINGAITVEGYGGNTIKLEVEKIIRAKDSEKLELGKKEITLETLVEGNEIVARIDGPCIKWREDDGFQFGDCNCNSRMDYDFVFNFKIQVPFKTNLEVTTVNNGEVLVRNTVGNTIKAGNINGGIDLENITGKTEVNAINGEVNISYANNPSGPSTYYSLNGDINITYQKNLSAAIAFKSMHGELFTDFDIEKQYAKTRKTISDKGDRPKYKFESRPIVQIGKGELAHDFETLNGNVIIKKI